MIALRFAVAAGLLSLAHSANAQTSVVSMPEEFAVSTEALKISDMNTLKSKYTVAEFTGERQRDGNVVNFQSTQPGKKSSFTLAGFANPGGIHAVCKTGPMVAKINYPAFVPQRSAFHSAFMQSGQPMHASFELQKNVESIGSHGTRMAQRGEINMDGTVLQIRSVHKMKDTLKRSPVPLGYLFEIDGKPVGGVALGDVQEVILPTTDDTRLRETVIAGLLALSMMWSPGGI